MGVLSIAVTTKAGANFHFCDYCREMQALAGIPCFLFSIITTLLVGLESSCSLRCVKVVNW